MERSEWLKQMQRRAETLYDRFAPEYWVRYGMDENGVHMEFLRTFLAKVTAGGEILSAGCGAGRYDGFLSEAGHPVTGIDQSEGMLRRAREHFPQNHYEQMRVQELPFEGRFAGAICIDALEHIFPEVYPVALERLAAALKPGGWLYFTVDNSPDVDLRESFEKARAQGLPVVLGEVADRMEDSYARVMATQGEEMDAWGDPATYHFYPSLEQVHEWVDRAGLLIDSEGDGDGYHHVVAKKCNQQ